jgi:hypothetical protein
VVVPGRRTGREEEKPNVTSRVEAKRQKRHLVALGK